MKKLTYISLIIMMIFCVNHAFSAQNETKKCSGFSSFFCKSLHFTGNGMRYWYEMPGGFMRITNIPYNRLGCKKCHATSCDKCHAIQKNGLNYFSLSKAEDMNTCFTCHSREKVTILKDKKIHETGISVHFSAGMNCMDCHTKKDIHGSGILYKSMRDSGAVDANCMKCHGSGDDAPVYNSKLRPHRVHKGRLDCAACHVSATMTCYNCHFQRFIETKIKKGNFFPMKSWVLLMNFKGKVTTGNVMTLIYKGKKFIAYAPYFTHSIMAEGRKCNECHGNRAIQLIKHGKRVPVVDYKDGKIIPWKGIVPCVPDKLKWVYLDKKGNKWIPIKNNVKETIQFVSYGKPLTAKQMQKLMIPFGIKKK